MRGGPGMSAQAGSGRDLEGETRRSLETIREPNKEVPGEGTNYGLWTNPEEGRWSECSQGRSGAGGPVGGAVWKEGNLRLLQAETRWLR